MELNCVIVRNANLYLLMDEFSKKFVSCIISFFINFFSVYNQVKLQKKSRDFMKLKILSNLTQMTTLREHAINFVF